MRDMAPLALIVREALSSEDMIALTSALLNTLPPHLARLCIVHRIAEAENPKRVAEHIIDELTEHFL